MKIDSSRGYPPNDGHGPHEAGDPLSPGVPVFGPGDAPGVTDSPTDIMSEFRFCTKLDQTILLGRSVSTLPELVEGIMSVPKSSIYYHTHQFLRAHHYLTPEPSNDFAYWIAEVINDVVLGEQLSSIDIVRFKSITDLRAILVEIIASHIRRTPRLKEAAPGEEFHFMASRLFLAPTQHMAATLAEFREVLRLVSLDTLYYHMFDAKLRLENGENDFSRWFRHLGKPVLADDVARLDPYTYTLEGLRKRLIVLVNKHDNAPRLHSDRRAGGH
jgi:hypothetical protein